MIVGVFDSGIGGQSVANAIATAMPELQLVIREDRQNVPYGSKSPGRLLELVTPILQAMVQDGCETIVIACNTVSTTIIEELRKRVGVPLLAVEPMIKPAAEQTKQDIIAVCATPATLASPRYAWLKQTYAANCDVLEPDCSDWSTMVETNKLDVRKIAERINQVLDAGADVVVLGCTHYHWIEHEIRVLCDDRAVVVQPEQAIIRQLRRVLARLA